MKKLTFNLEIYDYLRSVVNPVVARRKLFFLLFFVAVLSNAQTPSGIIWDAQVGCSEKVNEFDFNVEEPEECIKICQGSTVTYTLVGGDPQQWVQVDWDVSGGTIQNQTNTSITITWGNDLAGALYFSVETADEIYSNNICIELLPKPEVDFTYYTNDATPEGIEVCKGETVYFKNLSHPNGGSQLIYHDWYFPDDNSFSADFEPSHTFNQSGTFYVTLTETNECNCKTSIEVPVHVMEDGLKIECNSIACENEVENYIVTNLEGEPVDCESYEWIVQGGTIINENSNQVNVQWDQVDEDGFGYLTYVPEECILDCVLPVTIKVPVIRDEAKINGKSYACITEQFRYSIPKWATTEVEWKITPSTGATLLTSDQTNEIIVEANMTGTYILEAIYTNTLKGCGGKSLKEIEVQPTEKIVGPTTICQNGQGVFTTISGGSYDWAIKGPNGTDYDAGSTIQYQFNEPGVYSLYIGTQACLQPKEHIVLVKPAPEPPNGILGPTEVCLGEPIVYTVDPLPPNATVANWEIINGVITTNNTSQAQGNSITVIWDVNKSSPSSPYLLRVGLQKGGCGSTTPAIYPEPLNVDFNISGSQTVCSSSTSIYNVDYDEGEKYTWKIIPESLGSVLENPQDDEVEILWNNVSSPTQAVIEVTIEKCGNQFVETYPVTINETADISIIAPSVVCRDELVSFSIQGLTDWDNIIWSFGDGNQVSGTTNPTHTYQQLNTNNVNYLASVTVIHPNGCAINATLNHSIQVQPAPVAILDPATNNTFCSQQELIDESLTLNVILDSNYAAAQTIDWYKDGQQFTPSGGSTSHLVTQPGNYYVIVKSANGCTDKTNTVNVKIGDCSGSPDEHCLEVDVDAPVVTNTTMVSCNTGSASATYSGNPSALKWYLDDQEITAASGQTTATFPISSVGIHEVIFSAHYNSSTSGTPSVPCIYGISDAMDIIVPYEAQMSYEVTCTGSLYEIKLYNISDYFPTTPIQSELFRVNGGSFTTTDTYTLAPGSHTAELQIAGSGYPACTTSLTIDLPALPNPQITVPTEACAGEPVQFTVHPINPEYTYTWNFGDLAENSLPNPIRNYNPSSEIDYDVELTITNQFGCSATVGPNNIYINVPEMAGDLNLTPQTTCEGGQIQINYQEDFGSVLPNQYVWHHKVNGTIISTTTTSSPSLTVSEPGMYILDGVDNKGCTQYGVASVYVTFLETPEAYITGPVEVCAGETFELVAAPDAENNYTYEWKRNGQIVGGSQATLSQQLGAPGVYNYSAEVTTAAGCSEIATYSVEVFSLPAPPTVSVDLADCEPYTVILIAQANEPGTFVWSDGQTGPDVEVSHGGPYRVTFFADNGGCSSSTQIDVPENPGAYIWVHPEGCYDLCETQINDYYLTGPAIPFAEWTWSLNGSAINGGSGQVPNQNWQGNGLYQLALGNGQCTTVSNGMQWDLSESCRGCEIEWQVEHVEAKVDQYGNCYYEFYLVLDNYTAPLSYTINNLTNTGVFIPGGGYLPTGSTGELIEFYPPDNYNGGLVTISFTGSFLEDDTIKCSFNANISFPPCPAGSARGLNTGNPEGQAKFSVQPNPTSGNLSVTHHFAYLGEGSYTLHLYDLQGRSILQEQLKQLNGNTFLNLEEFANGLYLLVTRKDGKVIHHKKIVIQK